MIGNDAGGAVNGDDAAGAVNGDDAAGAVGMAMPGRRGGAGRVGGCPLDGRGESPFGRRVGVRKSRLIRDDLGR